MSYGFLHFNPDLTPQIPHNFRETCTGYTGQERENIPPCAAAETMEDLARRTDCKGRTFLLVKWAQAFQILTGSGQTDVLSDDLRDVDPVPNLIDDVFGNQASAHGSRDSSFSPRQFKWGQ